MRNSWILLSLLFLCTGKPAQGQDTPFPYTLKPAREAILIGSGSLLLQASAIGHNRKVKMDESAIAGLNAQSVNPFDRVATRTWNPEQNTLREKFEPASALLTATAVGTYGLYSKITTYRWEAMKTLGLMYLEGLYLSCGTMLVTKSIVNRPRPYAYNSELPMDSRVRGANNESFFSGNATVLFYHSVFFSQVFSDLFPESRLRPWIWGSTLSVAVFSGILSVTSGWHFPTDVLMGAAVGGLTGYLIPLLHKSETQKHLVMPWVSSSGCGLSLSLAL